MALANIEAAIWLALKARIDSLTTTPTLARAWPGTTFDPPSSGGVPSPYLAVSDIRNENERLLVGAGRHLRQGILQLSVMWPVAVALDHAALLQLAGDIAAHFPADLCMTYGAAKLRVEREPDVADPYVDAGYLIARVRVRWNNA